MLIDALKRFGRVGAGASGQRRPPGAGRAVAARGERSSTRPAAAFRNGGALRGKGSLLGGPQMAFYPRVDDGATMAGCPRCAGRANKGARQLADALTEAGVAVAATTEAEQEMMIVL